MKDTSKEYKYHLGLTMAGAVSAGCYSAGVMDYIFEVLDLWERAKLGKTKVPSELIPKNSVVIEAMGGASAGGMATIMTSLYALNGKINPVKSKPDNPMDSYNVLYDSWVHLDDEDDNLTFKKLWETDDLKDGVLSLLNTKVIDNIAKKAFTSFTKPLTEKFDFDKHLESTLPKFISKDLDVLLSHTLLSGIPLSVDFKPDIARKNKNSPKHNTFEHFLVSHFKLNNGAPVNENQHFWLNPFSDQDAKKMILSTIATGAFPIGLAAREFNQNHFTDNYVKTVIKRMIYGNFGIDNPDLNNQIDFANFPKSYKSITIDGGAINNEPYAEVASILKERFYNQDKEHQNFGLIMIDPFPDNDDKRVKSKKQAILDNDLFPKKKRIKDILDLIPDILSTLTNQSRIKRKEILERLSTDYFRGVIYPSKHVTDDNGNYKYKDKYPIASASFGAFGGFLDINFRLHDFFLGRDNARNFLRYYCSLPYDMKLKKGHPLHDNWTDDMIERYKRVDASGNVFLPIIPDLNIVLNELKDVGDHKYCYTIKSKPQYNPEDLFQLKSKIEKRVKLILTKILDRDKETSDKKRKSSSSLTSELMSKRYKRTLGAYIKGLLFKLLSKLGRKPALNVIAANTTKKITEMILKDLEKRKLISREKIESSK